MTEFRDLPDYLLAPLSGHGEDAWHRGPAGKWSPGEIVDHVTTAIELSAKGFASRSDRPAMTRRPRTLVQHVANLLIMRIGRFPRGRRAPESTTPQARPDRAATEARLRAGVSAFLELEQRLQSRSQDLFLKHPALGDLTIPEFMRFHVCHAEHHRRQVIERLEGRLQ